MNNSYSANRRNRKAPATRLLMAMIVVLLALVVANQIFMNLATQQELARVHLAADLRVSTQQLASAATSVEAGDTATLARLKDALEANTAAWSLLDKGNAQYLDAGFGIRAALPAQGALIDLRYPEVRESLNHLHTNVAIVMTTRPVIIEDSIASAVAETSDSEAADAVVDPFAAAVAGISADTLVLQQLLPGLADYFAAPQRSLLAAPFTGYAMLLLMLLCIGLYGNLVIRHSREAEQFTAEKNKRNNQSVLKLCGELSGLADGDLTVEATVGEDFTGPIADAVNYAVGQLRGLVSAITDVTLEVTTSIDSSHKMVATLAEEAQRQSDSIDSVYGSIRAIGKDIQVVSNNAQKSLEVARNSVQTAAGGADVVKDTICGMDSIRDQIQDTSKRIKRLGESSQEIGGFVSLINDIAEHTNTLSLNAAIQAASAGEAGRGFAVVADEVHALAERSGDATRKIESLVKVIQGDIKEAVQSMEQTTAEVVTGTSLARRAGKALDDIQQVSKELAELVRSISEASHNQSKAASEITGSMEVIKQVTSRTSGGIRETRDFMTKLSELTDRLKMTVSGFSLNRREKWARFSKKDNVMPMEPKKASAQSPALQLETRQVDLDTFPNRILSA